MSIPTLILLITVIIAFFVIFRIIKNLMATFFSLFAVLLVVLILIYSAVSLDLSNLESEDKVVKVSFDGLESAYVLENGYVKNFTGQDYRAIHITASTKEEYADLVSGSVNKKVLISGIIDGKISVEPESFGVKVLRLSPDFIKKGVKNALRS